MKILLLAAAVLFVGCSSSGTVERKDSGSTSSAPKNDANRDISECEREAALSGVGSRAQAFDSCMRARKRAATR